VEKLHEIEEITHKDSRGRLVKKYSLVKEEKAKPKDEVKASRLKKSSEGKGLVYVATEVPERRVLELAAWIRRKPTGWATDREDVKKGQFFLKHWSHLVPEIGKPEEDPDSYAFVWPGEALEELKLEGLVSSRFFDFKLVYDTVTVDLSKETPSVEPVFLGAYCSPVIVGYMGYYTHMQQLHRVGQPNVRRVINEPQSVCVAVGKEADGSIRVVYVETHKGKLDKAWVSGLAKQLRAKKKRMTGYDSLKEDVKRKLLLNLRGVFEQRKLLIPNRYAILIEDLLEYSYRKPSSGYVLALGIAADLCWS